MKCAARTAILTFVVDEVLCDACGRGHAITIRNCESCGRLLDKRMWRFAAKVEADYRAQGLPHSRARVDQKTRTLCIELPDASAEALSALVDQTRRRFRRVYGIPRARVAGFEQLVFTNSDGACREAVPVPPGSYHVCNRQIAIFLLAAVVLGIAPFAMFVVMFLRQP